MRKLVLEDAFKLSRIIKNANVKGSVAELYAVKKGTVKANDPAAVEAAGFEIVMTIVESCTEQKIESQIYDFLAGVFEITSEEVKNLDFDKLFENIKKLTEENNIINFMKLAGRLK